MGEGTTTTKTRTKAPTHVISKTKKAAITYKDLGSFVYNVWSEVLSYTLAS